jgi:DNA-binding response OmpR family regulator
MMSDIANLRKEIEAGAYVIVLPRQVGQPDAKSAFVAMSILRFGLSPGEARALAALARGDLVSRKKLLAAITTGPTVNDKIIDVIICKLRKKLRRHLPDAKIACLYKTGYQLANRGGIGRLLTKQEE